MNAMVELLSYALKGVENATSPASSILRLRK